MSDACDRVRRLASAYFDFARRWSALVQALAGNAGLRQQLEQRFDPAWAESS